MKMLSDMDMLGDRYAIEWVDEYGGRWWEEFGTEEEREQALDDAGIKKLEV